MRVCATPLRVRPPGAETPRRERPKPRSVRELLDIDSVPIWPVQNVASSGTFISASPSLASTRRSETYSRAGPPPISSVDGAPKAPRLRRRKPPSIRRKRIDRRVERSLRDHRIPSIADAKGPDRIGQISSRVEWVTDFVPRSDHPRHFPVSGTWRGIGKSPRFPVLTKKFSGQNGWPIGVLAYGLADDSWG